MSEVLDQNAWLTAEFKPVATYFMDSDCVEYVNEDTVCVYERIDDFLTLIWDETRYRTVGFKLKGFRWIFENHLRAHMELNQASFVRLVQVIEALCQEIGDELTADDKRSSAYRAARKIAEQGRAELWDLPLAA